MESFRVVTTLTLEDWQALKVEYAGRARERVSFSRSLLLIGVWAIVAFLVTTGAAALKVEISLLSTLFGMVSGGAIIFITQRIVNRRLTQEAAEAVVGKCTYLIDEAGVHAVRSGVETRYAWTRVRDISVGHAHLFVWISSYSAFIIPIRDLPGEVSADVAAAFVRARLQPADVREESPSEAHAAMVWWRAIPRWLTLRPTGPVIVTDSAVASLSLASLFLWSAIDRLRVGENAVFNSYNIPTLALCALAILLTARIIAKRSTRIGFRAALFTVLVVLPVAIVFDSLVRVFLGGVSGLLAHCILLAYLAVYLAFALRTQTGSPQLQRTALGVAVVVLLAALSNQFYWSPSLWYAPELGDEGGEAPTWSEGEALLFDQRARIDEALERVAAHDSQPSNFFVGFSGVAEQKVFTEEIQLASRVIGERFGTAKRSLLLLNDRRDVDAYPLATVSGLAYALQGVAAKMNVEHDVLILSLSSHGSATPELQVSNGVLPLQQVTGENLAAALDESGIKYRVLIVSACYAGAFIEPLQNENTIILAAAAKDKTSFGCSDDRDLTYFGEAFYRDALPKAASLREAFDGARTAIADRERRENVTPSDPQAFFGAKLELRLR
jgi:hypothetical protein